MLKHFRNYDMIQVFSSIPKYIQKENAIIKFKLTLKNVLITKEFCNITELSQDT